MTRQPSTHVLIWRDPNWGPQGGANALLGWQEYRRSDADKYFRKQGDLAALRQLAERALCADVGAIMRGANVTIAWQPECPDATPADELEPMFRQLRPMTLICPERPTGDRWAISDFGTPQSLPAAAIRRALNDLVTTIYPHWNPGAQFQRHGLMLRHDVSAEELGVVEPFKPTPDDIYASVAEDPEVVAAGKLWDRATPSTHRALVGAVLGAQARAGILEADRAPLHSGEVETYLTPLLMRMGRGDEADAVALIRRDTRRLYGEHAETVLGFMLRTYRHGGTERLLALATQKVAA